jgi:secreted trypsin-like serine protease
VVEVSIDSFAICNAVYQQAGGEVFDDTMICAAESGRDSCQGDSGGPMFLSDNTIAGLVSWGNGCAMDPFSGIYARTSAATHFIRKGICEMSANPPSDCDNVTNPSRNQTCEKYHRFIFDGEFLLASRRFMRVADMRVDNVPSKQRGSHSPNRN